MDSTNSSNTAPKDAETMINILKEMGVTDYEPRVVDLMLEFAFRYVSDVLNDAKIYSSHANKKTLDIDDVKLAIQFRMDHTFTTPPPRELLLELARHKNSQPLPPLKPYSGLNLPPERYCLYGSHYRMKSHRKPAALGHRTGVMSMSAMRPSASGPLVRPSGAPVSVLVRSALTARPTLAPRQPILSVVSGVDSSVIHHLSQETNSVLLSQIGDNSLKRKREDDDYDAI